MTVTLTPEQMTWIEAAVAAGHFPSVEEAVRVAVADLMAVEFSDLDWAKPYIEQARQSATRGDVVAGDKFLGRLDDKLKALRSR